jgi:hypothetical protein
VLTASADKTVKLWDVSGAAPQVITTFTFATKPEVEHMQVCDHYYTRKTVRTSYVRTSYVVQ